MTSIKWHFSKSAYLRELSALCRGDKKSPAYIDASKNCMKYVEGFKRSVSSLVRAYNKLVKENGYSSSNVENISFRWNSGEVTMYVFSRKDKSARSANKDFENFIKRCEDNPINIPKVDITFKWNYIMLSKDIDTGSMARHCAYRAIIESLTAESRTQ